MLFVYDNIGRRTDETWLDGVTELHHFQYTYDAASQLLSAADDDLTVQDNDSGYSYTYDLAGDLKEVDNWVGSLHTVGVPHVVLNYGYTGLGQVESLLTNVAGNYDAYNEYHRDSLGRVANLTQESAGGNVTRKSVGIEYTASGRFSSIESQNSSDETVAVSTYSYDPLEQLTSLVHRRANDSVVSEYYYSYDLAGRIITQGTSADEYYTPNTYSYNGNGELYSVDQIAYDDDVPYVSSTVANYVYDRNGNRVVAEGGIGANNQLLNDAQFQYAYDGEGNLISKTVLVTGAPTGAMQEFVWDYRNRLTEVIFKTGPGGSVTKHIFYSYDVNNQLIAREEDSDGDTDIDEEQHFVYDGQQVALVLNHDGEVTDRMLWGPAVDQLLAHEVSTDPEEASVVNWALGDHQGTIENWVDDDAVIVGTAEFDEFGKLGSNSGFGSTAKVAFGFTGKYRDTDTNAHYHLRRWTGNDGRWWNPDPSGLDPDTNEYRYTRNDPVNFTDPTGLESADGTGGMGGDLPGFPGGDMPPWPSPSYDPQPFPPPFNPLPPPTKDSPNHSLTPEMLVTLWALGVGPSHRNFVDGDYMTQQLRGDSNVTDAIQEIRFKLTTDSILGRYGIRYGTPFTRTYNKNNSGLGGALTFISDALNVLAKTGNLTVIILGSYDMVVQVSDIDYCEGTAHLSFKVDNSTSITSATRIPVLGYTNWWEENISKRIQDMVQNGLGATTTQTFKWDQEIDFSSRAKGPK